MESLINMLFNILFCLFYHKESLAHYVWLGLVRGKERFPLTIIALRDESYWEMFWVWSNNNLCYV